MQDALFFCFLVFAVLALYYAVCGLLNVYFARQSLSWRPISAEVSLNRVRRYISPGDGPRWQHEFSLRYEIAGNTYHCQRAYFGLPCNPLLGTYGLKVARNIVYSYPENTTAKIYVHPDKPGFAVLLPGINRLTWLSVLVLPSIFALLAAVLLLKLLVLI